MRQDLHSVLAAARLLPPEELPELLGELEQIRCTAMARLTAPSTVSPIPDESLDVQEAARRLGVSTEYLYRHHNEFKFTRREGRKLLFSSAGIAEYLHKRH
jgi:excisionase family DNA binding protein